jgi:hypothetical protein
MITRVDYGTVTIGEVTRNKHERYETKALFPHGSGKLEKGYVLK